MSNVKISELADGTITLESFIALAGSDGVAFKGTVDELQTFVNTITVLGLKAAISAADAAPTEDGLFPCQDTGTYTNFGGLVVDISDTITFISVSNSQTVFKKVEIPITFIADGVVAEGNTSAVSGGTVFDKNYFNLKKEDTILPYDKSDLSFDLSISSDTWWLDKTIYVDNYRNFTSFSLYKALSDPIKLGFFTIDDNNNYASTGSYTFTNTTSGWNSFLFSDIPNKATLMPVGTRVYIAISSSPGKSVSAFASDSKYIYGIAVGSASGTLGNSLNFDLGFYLTGIGVENKIKLILPDVIDTYAGDTIQVFKNSIINSIDYEKYNITASSTKEVGVLFAGKDGNRYWEYFAADANDFFVTFYLYNDTKVLIDSKTVKIRIKSSVLSPSTNTNVLFMGDSLTFYNRISDEFKRVLTSSDATTTDTDNTSTNTVVKFAGKSLTNINCVGTQLVNFKGWTGVESHEGYSGWEWLNFISSGSPFWISGALNFSQYLTNNSISSIDVLYIGLGWNDIYKSQTNINDNSLIIDRAKVFLRALHTQLPNTVVYLWGENTPGTIGGLRDHPFGSDVDIDVQLFKIKMLNLIESYRLLCAETEFSSYVSLIGSNAVFDSENMLQQNTARKNIRITNTEPIGTDDVHPSDGGFFQLTDSFIRSFIYNHGA